MLITLIIYIAMIIAYLISNRQFNIWNISYITSRSWDTWNNSLGKFQLQVTPIFFWTIPQTSEFLELLDTLNLSQVMNRPSHRLGYTLDCIITVQGVNLEDDDICVPTPWISDHILFAFKLSVQKPTLSCKTVITRDWKSLHLEQLNYNIIRTGFRHSYHDFSECVYQYDDKLRTLLDVHTPRAGKPSWCDH